MEKENRVDNRGFSVLAVIVAIAFVGVLVMIVLALSLANYRMIQTDLGGKKSFYSAETAMDEIRAGLQEKAGDALSDAYVKVLEQYTNTTGEDSLQRRKTLFESEYVRLLQKSLAADGKLNQYSLKMLDGFIQRDRLQEGEVLYLDSSARRGTDGSSSSEAVCKLTGNRVDGVTLYGVAVTCVDRRGRASVVESDLVIGIPDINFTQSSTMPDLLNMTMIAQEGVVVRAGNSEISGTFYAGKNPNLPKSGEGYETKSEHYGIELEELANLLISSGERVVTNGTVYLNQNSSLTVERGVSLWARNVELTSAELHLRGKTYLADDLTIHTAVGNRKEGTPLKGSEVELSGEYYGYGSPETAKESNANADHKVYDGWRDTSLSSSIIVNGADTTLDLSGLSKLMIAGNSYIGGKKAFAFGTSSANGSEDILTGESLMVKGGQIAYLVPASCLYDGSYSNPMTYAQYQKAVQGNTEVLNKDKKLKLLGGKSLKELQVSDVKKIFTQKGFVYFYLDFGSDEDASDRAAKYFRYYWEQQEDGSARKRELENYLNFYINDENGIVVNSPDRYLRYVTNGNLLSSQNGKLQVEAGTEIGENILQEQKNYEDIFYTLNKKMINNYAALKKAEDSESGKDEGDPDRFVFENIVNIEKMKKYIEDADGHSGDESVTAEKDGMYVFQTAQTAQRAYIVDTANPDFKGREKTFHITKEIAEGSNPARLVVCNGPVTVDADVTYRGIIISNDVVTLDSNAKILSEGEEAAKVFQCQFIDGTNFSKDQMRPMDFFWDSVQYIINGAASGGNTDTKKDVLDLSDLVVYRNWNKK